MPVSRVLFSSDRMDWATPPELYAELNREFGFGLDAAASDTNHLCRNWLNETDNALDPGVDWGKWSGGDPVWLNPPYGRSIGKWVAKAAQTAKAGTPVVCLLPSRTDTRYWHDHIWDIKHHQPRYGVEVRFLRGRVKFVGAEFPAPFPSVVVIFRPPHGPHGMK